jgi:hypothetical protein
MIMIYEKLVRFGDPRVSGKLFSGDSGNYFSIVKRAVKILRSMGYGNVNSHCLLMRQKLCVCGFSSRGEMTVLLHPTSPKQTRIR